MTEEIKLDEQFDDVKETLLETDWYLARLVDIVNGFEHGSGFQLTMTVAGQLVSGTLIGGKEYFTLLGDRIATGLDGDSLETTRSYFSEPASLYGPDRTEDRQGPRYLHMRDARFFYANGNPIPMNDGLLWRCKLSSVDSFALGKLAAERA